MSPSAIYSKSGKGVQEASGKTSHLPRAERAVLSAFDGKMTVQEVADKVGKPFDAKFQDLIVRLDKDGFVRQVSAGAPAPAAKPGAAKPGGAAPKAPGEDLDFTIAIPAVKAAPKPAAPPPAPPVAPHMAQSHAAAFAKAREEAEEKAARERERIKAEAEAAMRTEMEAKARSDAEARAKSEAEARIKAEAEAKIKAARDAAVRAAAEAKAKAEAEAQAKLEAERARIREAEEKARREAEEARRQAEEAKRKAEEEARKAREEAERIRKEAEEAKRQAEEAKRKAEEEARRIREEAERRAKEEERRRKEEEERRRKEEEARRAREEQERKEREARERQEREAREKQEREAREKQERDARERQEREAREKADRQDREREEEQRRVRDQVERAEREQREEEARAAREAAEREKAAERERAAAAKPAKPESFGDSLLADLDSFSKQDDEDRKAKEEAARKDKEAAQRRREEAERDAKDKAEREAKDKARAEEERRREEEARRAREEEKREEEKREAEKREREEAERARKEEARRARRAKEEAKPEGDDDIPLSDDDLDLDEVKKDEAALTKESRRAAREREERERQAKKDAKRDAKRAAREDKEDKDEKKEKKRREEPAAPPQFRRPRKWGKTIATTFFFLLVAGVGALHVMPVSTAEYEAAASQAVGRPVRIGSANLSLYSGVQLKFTGVSIGDTKIATVRGFPEIGSLFDAKKNFTRIELDGVTLPQESAAALFGAKVRGDNFTVGRVLAKQVKLTGPLVLPPMEVELALGQDGTITSTSLRGAEGLSGKLTPKANGELELDVVAHTFSVPILPEFSMSGFAMKGTATREGMRIESWGGSSLDGAVSGSANVRWTGGAWQMDGVLTVRGINAAVFAPALLSEGKAEGTGRFSFNDADPMSFLSRGRIEGTYAVHKGVLGSFDLSRAIQTGGRQAQGRTPFSGLSGQGVFDKGVVALRNVSFSAGAMNAGASADIARDGDLSGRIVADVRTPSQTLRVTLQLGGTARDPQVRN